MAIKEHFEGKRDLGLIDPRKLSVDPEYNVRDLEKPEAREGLDYLKSLIRTTGVQTALRIREDNDGKLIVVRGHRRLKVVMELIEEGHPIKLVPVTQEPRGTTAAERNWDLIDSNSEEPLKGFERADVLYRQIHAFGWSEEEILKRTGKTRQWLDQQLELRTIAPEAKKMVDEGTASITTVREATKQHGDKAVEVLKQAAKQTPTTGKKKGRVTQATVAKVTGKTNRAKEEKDRLLDFVSVAGKMDDAVKLAGGLDKVAPERLNPLIKEAITTLAKTKGQKVDELTPPQPEPPAPTPVAAEVGNAASDVTDDHVASEAQPPTCMECDKPAAECRCPSPGSMPTSPEPKSATDIQPYRPIPLNGFEKVSEPIIAAIRMWNLDEFHPDAMVPVEIKQRDAKAFLEALAGSKQP